jgi:hypothetical protein
VHSHKSSHISSGHCSSWHAHATQASCICTATSIEARSVAWHHVH